MNISTNDISSLSPILKLIHLPAAISHKGQNGKVLVIGGSSLFHGAVIWSAEVVSHIADMVHVASTIENNDIIRTIKTKWQTGMVVAQKDIPHYAHEDNVILVGNGMMRTEKDMVHHTNPNGATWEEVMATKDEGSFTWAVVHHLITHFPEKQFVFDAGALQMMDPEWLKSLHRKAIITPHQKEFQTLFGIDISTLATEEKSEVVNKKAVEYGCIILLKAIEDIVSDGTRTIIVKGGNAGLTKGGTGDILAGLAAGMSCASDPFIAAVAASVILKKTAEHLFEMKGYWYTVEDILSSFPGVLQSLTYRSH